MNRKRLSLILATALALFLVPTLLSILSYTQVIHAATFTVDTLVDESDNDCFDDDCSLRDAISAASNGDIILIPTGTYPLSDTLGQLVVTQTITFSGTGSTPADVVIIAGVDDRHFRVESGTPTFFNLTLQDGNPDSGNGGAISAVAGAGIIIDSAIITNNQTIANGGAVALTNGSLTLTNSQILSNTAGNNGGGIFTNNGPITVDNSQVMTNTAVNNGGGIALNLQNASLVMNSGQINGNVASSEPGSFPGGGVFVALGTFTLNDGEIRNNSARRGGGVLLNGTNPNNTASAIINGGQIIDNEADYGGGIYVRGANASLTINSGEVTQNRSVDPGIFGGGGLYIFQGLATLNGGEISFNTALNDGGGMEIGDPAGRFTQTGGEIFSNSAGNMGGAIHNSQGTVNISGGMIYANDSGMQGGGIYAADGSSTTLSNSAILTNTSTSSTGGGIHNLGALTMTNVTLSDNGASDGAGLLNGGSGTAVLTNVTISDNTAVNNGGGISSSGGTLTVGNSIIFGNSAPSDDDCNGSVTSANFNIAGATCAFSESNDSSIDPMLQPLALNGGDSLNFALGAGSSAIDAGSNALCPSTDQRGNLRPVGGTCDIGAYEAGIGFFINDVTLSEGDAGPTQMNFTVNRSFITDTTYTVDYEAFDDTALDGLDYTAVSDTLEFLPGDMTKMVTIDILGDTLDEEDEQFTVVLSNPSGSSQLGDDASGTGTILDDDAPPSLTINDVTIDPEGDSGTVTAVFTATLSAQSAKEITVDYATQDGTATAGTDYTAVPTTTLTFTPGDVEESFSVTVNGDTLDEIDEMFTVELGSESNLNLTDSSAQVTITDDDPEPALSIADLTSITEGDSGTTTANFIVTLDAPSGKTVTVDYTTADNTATAGSDYVTDSGTLTFTPGDTEETISITINGDTIDETNETFQVILDNMPGNATINDGTATGTINDDDPLPTATISDATVTEGDSGTVTAVFTVTLSAASEKTITINYSSANDSATAGEDYTAVSGTLTFNPGGSLSQTINVDVHGDQQPESTEQFFINLTGSNGNVTLGNSQGVGTILDDDGTFIYLPFIVKP